MKDSTVRTTECDEIVIQRWELLKFRSLISP